MLPKYLAIASSSYASSTSDPTSCDRPLRLSSNYHKRLLRPSPCRAPCRFMCCRRRWLGLASFSKKLRGLRDCLGTSGSQAYILSLDVCGGCQVSHAHVGDWILWGYQVTQKGLCKWFCACNCNLGNPSKVAISNLAVYANVAVALEHFPTCTVDIASTLMAPTR